MGDPVSAAILVASSIAGAVSDFNVADSQADALDQQARLANQQARAQAEQEERDVRRELGAARAQGGASGTSFSGSRLDFFEDFSSELYLKPATTRHQGLAQSLELRGRANLTRDQALANLGTSLLNTAGSANAASLASGGSSTGRGTSVSSAAAAAASIA